MSFGVMGCLCNIRLDTDNLGLYDLHKVQPGGI